MKKKNFITMLHYKLSSLPEKDVLERLTFIGEMIDDRIEEGYTEEDAINDLGPIDDLAARIIEEVNAQKTAEQKNTEKPKNQSGALALTLILLGSPLWISLAIAALVLVVTAYAVIWSVIGSLWAVFGALAGVGAGGILASIIATFQNFASGAVLFGGSLFSLGLSLPAFYGCLWATRGAVWLSKKIALEIKKLFTRR